MAKGVDFGTAILVVAEKDEDGKTIVRSERDCFISFKKSEFEQNSAILEDGAYNFIEEEEDGEQKIFIVGKDAIKLDNLFSAVDSRGIKVSNLRRPMQRMIINSKTDKKAIIMLKYISQNLLGKSKEKGEICVFSCPANSVEGVDATFHKNMCRSFVAELGYKPIPINEALAVVYATNPTTTDPDEGEIPMTGIGMSFGGGGSNGCVAYKGKDTITLSVARGGDWIDSQVSECTQKTPAQVTVDKERWSKEKILDLSIPYFDQDELKSKHNFKESDIDTLNALHVFYRELITEVVTKFKQEFLDKKITFENSIEVVISGGTSKPAGFDKMVSEVIEEVGWPFEIKGVRRAKDALASTALGCLAAAISREKQEKKDKKNKNENNNSEEENSETELKDE